MIIEDDINLRHYRRTISLLMGLAAAVASHAQEVGGYAGAYLRRALGASDVGMGGAFVPFVSNGDGSAILGNSAALARLERPTLLISYSSLPFQQQVQSLGFGMRFGEFLGLGVGVVSFGGAPVESYDAREQSLGRISSRDLAFSMGAGMAIGPANLGATIRYLRFIPGNGDLSPSGYSLDLNGTWEFEQVVTRRDWLAAAVSVKNVAGEMTNVHDVIPLTLHLGGAYLHPLDDDRVTTTRLDPSGLVSTRRIKPRSYILGSVEARLTQYDSTPTISVGMEWAPVAEVPFGVRLGFDTRSDIAGGFFVSLAPPVDFARNIRLDFASRRDFELGDISYHITLAAGF